jgi:hypothetical protein
MCLLCRLWQELLIKPLNAMIGLWRQELTPCVMQVIWEKGMVLAPSGPISLSLGKRGQ